MIYSLRRNVTTGHSFYRWFSRVKRWLPKWSMLFEFKISQPTCLLYNEVSWNWKRGQITNGKSSPRHHSTEFSCATSPGYKSLLSFVRNQAQALINQRRTFLPSWKITMWSVFNASWTFTYKYILSCSMICHTFVLSSQWLRRDIFVIFFYFFSLSLSVSLRLCQYIHLYTHPHMRSKTNRKTKQFRFESNKMHSWKMFVKWKSLSLGQQIHVLLR